MSNRFSGGRLVSERSVGQQRSVERQRSELELRMQLEHVLWLQLEQQRQLCAQVVHGGRPIIEQFLIKGNSFHLDLSKLGLNLRFC